MPSLRRLLLAAACLSLAVLLLARVLAGTAAAAGSCLAAGIPTATVYLPNITKTLGGPNGWVTPIYVQNAGAVQTAVELTFLRFSDGQAVACHRTEGLPPGASLVDNPNDDADLPGDTQFSVVARSYGAEIAALVNQVQGTGSSQEALAYTGFTQGDRVVFLPNVTRRFFGYDVPFIVQNLGTASASVTARFLSFDGSRTYTRAFTVAPGRSGVVDPDFEPAFTGAPNSGLVDGTQYAVTITSDQPVAVVANAHNEQGSPVAFSHTGIARGGTVLYAPYAVKDAAPDGAFSPIVVQNLGAAPADATLVFTPATGAPQTFALRAIPAAGAQAFDPRFAAGTTTPCTGASATCLGSGEYALRITSASPIAAVVLPNSATTAAAYLASTDLSQRVLVPAAFRRIGGASGWNTRMAVYTGREAQLTVRAYSVATGDVATTFPVVVGAAGWTSFDLGAVAGLVDGEQYSVTIDGGGLTLTAVALERASTGGDTFMALEAIGRPALPAISRPASIRVTPAAASTFVGWQRQLTAVVKDQFGSELLGYPRLWSIAPAGLGAIDATGRLTAGTTPGAGAITVSAGAVATAVPLTVSAPGSATLGGIAFTRYAADGADVYTATTITGSAAQTIVTQVESDVARVEADYARSFSGTPTVFALDTATTFAAAARDVGGIRTTLPDWAAGVCVCYGTNADWVFVNWSLESGDGAHTTIRHELTHVMQHDAIDPRVVLPAWFDEGNARGEEMTVQWTQWWAAVQRYRSASMASLGRLFSLDDLASPAAWSARSAADATYEYAVAYQAVTLLRSDLGAAGLLRLFALMDEGHAFDDAYAIVSARTIDEFAAMLPHRVLALAPAYPGVASAPDSPAGPGLTFIVYGLPPDAPVSYRFTGPTSSVLATRSADAYGVVYGYIDDRFRPGTYTFTLTWSGGTITGTAVKPQ